MAATKDSSSADKTDKKSTLPKEPINIKKSAVKKTTAKRNDAKKYLAKASLPETVDTAAKVTVKKAAVQKGRGGKTTAKKDQVKSRPKKRYIQYEGKTLVVVESPAKAKTLEKILGSKYKVLASVGHVRDLPKARMAIDVENGFEPEYIQVRGKADLIRDLKGASEASKYTLLAADPDREGEAIAWHVASLLDIAPESKCRIRMHEITPSGVKKAVSEPDNIDMNKVEAQQARRVLDRLVGYELSPLLWNKVQRGLSAGRVQSVALLIICEREEEIEKFIPEEYYLIDVNSSSLDDERKYQVRLDKYRGKTIKVRTADEAAEIEKEIRRNGLKVDEFKTKESERAALSPLKTSTLQQEASRRLGFAPRVTMRIAQSLYEGVDIPGRGPTGLITYMRTDSLRLAPDAVTAARKYINENIGEEYLSKTPNSFVPKGKAQDAHEAIRATDPFITPKSVEQYLSPGQYRLYELIWNRYVATQMAPARIARTTLTCASGDYLLKQTGVVILFDGWGKIFPLGVKNAVIEPASEGEELKIIGINSEQRFTQPPARYSEAGLIKVLEEDGIGRPSTYATIIETLSYRRYVTRGEEDKKLVPTKLGRIVNNFLVKYFPKLINVGFTANMEGELDGVEAGDLKWREVIAEFWKQFKPTVDGTAKNAETMRPEPELIGEQCPQCGKDLIKKSGRFGEFIACTGYPECRYTRNIVHSTGVKCPKCEDGELIKRKISKGRSRGRVFYGCSRYPDCDYVTWENPNKKNSTNGEAVETDMGKNVETDM